VPREFATPQHRCVTSAARPGTVVVFDEIEDLLHECKALCDDEPLGANRLNLVAATEDCRQAALSARNSGGSSTRFRLNASPLVVPA
jgi:hypothetical protein